MDQITETPSLATDLFQHVKRIIIDITNPLKGKDKVGIPSVILDSDLMTRRRFLQHLGILGIVLVAPVLRDLNKRTRPQRETFTEESPTPLALASETVKILDPVEERLFKNFSPAEKADVEKEIAEQIKIYQAQTGHKKKADRVLDWEKTTIKPILDLDVQPQNQQFWKELLSAVVFVESEGKHLVESDIGALGLAQLTPSTAEGTAKKHGILKFDLKKGWDNLRLSRFLLEDLMERFGPDLALLGYYGGQPFADQKVLAALEKRGISNDQQLRSYIDRFQINIANLGSEDGKEYLTKIVAAHRILREAKTS